MGQKTPYTPAATILALALLCLTGSASFATPSQAAGTTPEDHLFEGVEQGSSTAVLNALKEGATITAYEPGALVFPNPPLLQAVTLNHGEIVEILLDHGAEINQRYPMNQRSALTTAIDNQNLAMVQLLLKRGADPNTRHGFWRDTTPLYIATQHGNLAMVRLLLEYEAKVPSYWSNFWESCKAPFTLLFSGVKLDFSREPSLLDAATESGNQELYQFLKKQGAR